MTAVFGEDARVELIEGDILDMTPIGNRHLMYVDNLNDLLVPKVRSVATVRVQGSIRLHDRSEPQPTGSRHFARTTQRLCQPLGHSQ